MNSYQNPLSIAAVLQTEEVIGNMLALIAEEAIYSIENANDPEFIPPVMYSERGRCFNVDYNFLIRMIGRFIDEKEELNRFIEDFFIRYDGMQSVEKNALFLVANILEEYYGIVGMNSSKIDLTKYRNARSVTLQRRFFNTICYENGANLKRFRSVHFMENEVKKVMDIELFNELKSLLMTSKCVQVCFGDKQYVDLLNERKLESVISV